MFLGPCLRAQVRCDFVALGLGLSLLHKFLERAPLLLGVESRQPAWIVVRSQLLGDPPILLSGHVARREMQEPRVIRRSYELKDIDRSVRISREGVAQVGIEIRQARAVNNQIQVLLQMAGNLGAESKPRLGDVPFDDLDLLAQKIREPVSMPLKQRIEHRRLFHHLLETPLRRIRLLPADQ